MEEGAAGLHASAFGGLSIEVDGTVVSVRGRQRRRMLAALLLESPRPLSVERLLDLLGRSATERGTADPSNAVHALARRLRELIEPGTPAHSARYLRSTSDGYVVLPDRFDLWDYRQAIELAAQLEERDPEAALGSYRRALGLWKEPWSDLRTDSVVADSIEFLEGHHLFHQEAYAELALNLGHGTMVADELVAFARAEPVREHRWAQAIRALFQANRQAEALRLFEEARRWLGEELGLGPGPELTAMERAVLRQDRSLLGRPQQELVRPVPLTRFIGRTGELGALDRAFDRHRVVTVTGLGGVGKSRLVLEWQRRSRPAGDTSWVDLRGTTSGHDVAARVTSDLGLGSTDDSISPHDVIAATMGTGPRLLILDNAEGVVDAVGDIVGRLTAALPNLRVAVTSRVPLGLSGEVTLLLAPLPIPPDDDDVDGSAVELVLDRMGHDRDEALARSLAVRFGGFPLPLELVAAVHDQGLEFDGTSGPVVPCAAESSIADAVDAALEHVSAPAVDLLWTTLQFPAGSTAGFLAAVHSPGGSRIDEKERGRLLRELVRASLLHTVADAGGLRYEGLVPVAEIARAQIDPEERRRVLVAAAHRWSTLARASFFEPPRRAGLVELAGDHHNIVSVLHELDLMPAEILMLASRLVDNWERTGRTAEGREWIRRALERVQPGGGPLALANAALVATSGGIGAHAQHLGLVEVARDALVDSGEDDGELWAIVHVQLAIALGWDGDLAGSSAAMAVARDQAERHGSEWFLALVDRYECLRHALTGDPAAGSRQAVVVAERFESLDDPNSAAGSLYFASVLGRMAGQDDLEDLLARARSLAEVADSPGLRALIAVERGQHARRRRDPAATELLDRAATLTERTGNLRTGAVTRRDLGILLLEQGRTTAAATHLSRSARHLVRLDASSSALALAGLAALARAHASLSRALATTAWRFVDSGSGTPIPPDDLAAIEQLAGPRPGRATPVVDAYELIHAAEESVSGRPHDDGTPRR